jgi:hypothetical protein
MKHRIFITGFLGLMVLTGFGRLWAEDEGAVRITEYKFKEYRRSPMMEELDRQNGRGFTWTPGLEIITDIYDVEIKVFEESAGRTPWEENNMAPGAYRVLLERTGYEPVEFWVTVRSDRRTVVEVVMSKPSGRLSLSNLPPDAVVLFDRERVSGNEVRASGGRHNLTVTAFGWNPVKTTVTVPAGEAAEWIYTGTRAPFALDKLKVRPKSLPPGDPRGFEFTWAALSAGSGEVRVLADDGARVAAVPVIFSGPKGTVSWAASESDGFQAVDGKYQVLVSGTGYDGNTGEIEATLTLDSRFKRKPRPSYSPLPGLLYAPGTAILPPGLWQASTGAGVDMGTGDSEGSDGIPINVALRVSPGRRWEIGAGFGMAARDPFDATSIDMSVSGSFRINPSPGNITVNTALLFDYAGYATKFGTIPTGTPGMELPGLQLAFPMEYALGNWSAVLSPSVYLTFLGTESDSWEFSGPARTAGALSAGGYYENDRFLLGASMALRTPDLPGGFLDWHLWSGIDGRFDLPGNASYIGAYLGVRALSGDPVVSTGIEFGVIR